MDSRKNINCSIGVILFFSVLILYVSSVSAYVGVSPAVYEVEFEPGLQKTFYFGFQTDNEDAEFETFATGDLSEFVKVTPKNFKGANGVNVFMTLPHKIETPGVHKISIAMKQKAPEDSSGISLVAEMRGLIKVKVPYPGKYAETEITAKNANAGEPVEITLVLSSKGSEALETRSTIKVYNQANELVKEFPAELRSVGAGETAKIQKVMESAGMGAGRFKVVSSVAYGGSSDALAESEFRLGELYVGITNATDVVERGKINPFRVNVESFWNDPIDGVYAIGKVVGHPEIPEFRTPSEPLRAWETEELIGHFDTTLIEEDKFQVEIIAYYNNKTTQKTVDVRFRKEANYLMLGLIAGFVIMVLIVIVIFIKMMRLQRQYGQKKKKK